MAQSVSLLEATIPSLGNAVAVTLPTGVSLRAIITPVSFEGQDFTFEGEYLQAGPGEPIYDGYSLYRVPCGAEQYVLLPSPEKLMGLRWLNIISNVGGVPSNVAASRTLRLVFASE
jgi:hypothetical protein